MQAYSQQKLARYIYHNYNYKESPSLYRFSLIRCHQSGPFLDHVLSELRTRCSVHKRIVTHLWSLNPKFIASYSFNDHMYNQHLPFMLNSSNQAVQEELDIWKKRWADKVDCPDTAIDVLAVCDNDISCQIRTSIANHSNVASD